MASIFNKRKKNSRQRASSSHGWGAKKKHRGAGHRGGRGKAGSGKRGDAKKPSFWKDKKNYGKHGFKSKSRNKVDAISISRLDSIIEKLVLKGFAHRKDNTYLIDLSKIRKNKLLSNGSTTKKFEITSKYASAKAVEKIAAAGGKVEVLHIPDPATEDFDEKESQETGENEEE